MNTPDSLTICQKNFLKDLYKKKSPITKRELQSQPEKYNLSEIYSLIDANSNLIRIRGKNTFNESVEITCEGKAVVEAIRKQNSDERYKRNADKKSHLNAILSVVLTIASIVVSILLAIFA